LPFRRPIWSSRRPKAPEKPRSAITAPDDYPYLVEIVTRLPETGYDPALEFEWGFELILDALGRLRRET
jgi:hypothetical protein